MKTKKYKIIILIILIYLFLYKLILRGNIGPTITIIKNILVNKEIIHQGTPQYFINYLNENINNIIPNCNDYVLVDFGCGDGSAF